MTGIQMIAEERERQITKEGWSKEHDEDHSNFELTKVAILYAASSADIEILRKVQFANGTMYEDFWPFECCEDKREKHDELKKLVIAGALIAAEIDRLESKTEIEEKGKEIKKFWPFNESETEKIRKSNGA